MNEISNMERKLLAYRDMRDLAEAEYHRYTEIDDLENAQIFKNYIDIFNKKILKLFKELGKVPQSMCEQRSVYGRDASTGDITEILKIDKEVEYDPISKTCIKKNSGVLCDIDGDFSRPWQY